ncbi:MAG: methyltransferase domain-containing protein, partial [Candidatus Latescibacteria bacterium]|nr:methyltransferase domain-containing protein [Candidatus Latescibacterota bacterium]
NDRATMVKLQQEVGSFLNARNGVFAAISNMKHDSWGLEGFVVRPGINLEDYGGYTGEDAVALSVGNLFVERDHMLGFRFIQEILQDVPGTLVGANPKVPEAQKAENWDVLKAYFRKCRVYVNATVEAFEDGYNLGMLEAMATGMPVVCVANATSPIVEGENGYISNDTPYLRDRVLALLDDADLAKKMGDRARETVAEVFSVGDFVENWQEIVVASIDRFANKTVVDMNRARKVVPVDLETPRDALYPYEWADVEAFLAVDSLDDITVAKLKLDRMGAGHLCDIFLGNKKTGQTMAWQGLEVFAKGNIQVQWPSYLGPLDSGIRQVIEGAVLSSVEQVEKGEMGDAQSIHVNLGGGDAFEFRVGDDRVTPGDARSDIYLHHAKRYTFARQFCYRKTVVDLGSGAGYGAKLLMRDASRVVGLDLEPNAQQFANRVFGNADIRRLVGDIRKVGLKGDQFDVAVCFEAMEHVREHDDLLSEIQRLLKADGTLVISTPNKKIYDLPANANEYHVGMLELDEFEALLNRYYEDVSVYGQMRAEANQPFYDAFNFRDGVDDGDEVFVAVCKVPRAKVLQTEKPKAPAVHVKAPAVQSPNGERRLKVLVSHVSNPISMGRYYVDAFRQAHDVITCGPVIDSGELKQWREAEEQHAFKSIEAAQVEKLDLIGRLAQPCDIPMERGQVDIAQVLDKLPKGWQPDLMMWVDSATGFMPMGLEKLDCPTVCLSVDTHTGQSDWRLQYAKLFSHTYLVHNQFIDQFKAAGCPFVGWLPSACAPEIHGQIPANKSYDIGFVGQTHRQWHPHRVRLLDRLVHAGFDVHIESKILQEMALFNSRSKIVFNRSLNGDLNMRVFESLCSGSMLLTDRLDDNALLNDLFKDREHLVMYDDDNLEELVRYYLKNDDEREAIAAAGRAAVLGGHTYAHRADQVISEVIAQAGVARCVSAGDVPVPPVLPLQRANVKAVENEMPRGAGTAESAIAELVAYTGEPLETVRTKLPNAGELLTEEWRSTERKSEVAVDAFYKETEHFIYDLTHFNYANMYMGWRGSVYNLCQQVSDAMPAFEVLDYGGGIGTSLLELGDLPGAHLTYADLPGKTYDYANWRFQQRGLKVSSIALGDDDPLAGRVFDVIVCMEVIEHLVEPEQVVKYLIDHLKPGGLLILTVTFYAPEPDMMHLNLDRYTNEGFYEIVQNMGMQELTKFSPRIFKKSNQPAALSSQLSRKAVAPPHDSSAQGFSPKDPNAGEKFKQLIQSQNGPVKLNLGCGEDRRAGYINVDAYVPTADLQMDIFDLQMEGGIVDEVFSSHMLEHLSKFEVPKALTEWHRVLKPGGRLCLNLPDLEWCMAQWLRTPEEQRWGWTLDTIYGLQTHDGEYHKTGFTVARAEQLMEAAGFANVKVSWTWSHGMRCLWVEAMRPELGKLPGVTRSVAMDRFEKQFPIEISELVSYSQNDVADFFEKDWHIGFVSFEKLPMDSADFTLNVAVVSSVRQMVLQGIRIFSLKQNPFVIYPDYLKCLTQTVQEQLNKSIGDALGAKINDANDKEGAFVIARFGQNGDLGLEQTDVRIVPGLAEHARYILHAKQYMLAEQFAEGARVLDTGCGTGYGAKRLSHVAARVDAVDLDADTVTFAKRTYGSDRINWSVGDVKDLDVAVGGYDLVTSFGVIEQLDESDIAQYLDGINRALRPGGVALISMSNANQSEMALDKFDASMREVFADVTLLGQTQWSEKTEVSGQCVVSGRVTDEDGAYVAVCVKREISEIVDGGFVPKVSIVMPLYNKSEFTEKCLNGLEDTRSDVPFEVILVDNGSADHTGDLLDGVVNKTEYRVIRNGENLGFSRGNNVGAQLARGEYVLFLNNDTVPRAGWLEAMVSELDGDASVGIVGAKLLYPDT